MLGLLLDTDYFVEMRNFGMEMPVRLGHVTDLFL
jgi:hypothetical protein